ncbi:MAG TPA: DUF1517 domain-containing protein [Kofleriaceae bacterium]|nr:DUF1517 domain-containing protein [Kofleriaceae bacterium]
MRALVVAIALCLAASVAHAQETGGHMGGGDWGGGGGGGGTSYSGGGGFSSSPSSSPSWSSSSGWSHTDIPSYKPPEIPSYKPPTYTPPSTGTTNTGSGSYEMSPEERARIAREMEEFHRDFDRDRSIFNVVWWLAVLFIGGVFVKIMFENAKEFLGGSSAVTFKGTAPPMDTSEIDVTVLRVVIDGRARKFIQTSLRQIAQSCDTSTRDGRAAMLSQVTLLLRKVRDAWIYGGARNEPMGMLRDMKATYDRHVDDARTRFTVETISNAQGRKLELSAGPLWFKSDEGEGVILVTIVIAARTELFTVQKIADGEDLRKALEGAGYLGPDLLVAVDVIWTPSEENDRMSTMELEARYPAPMLIPIQGALVGKTFCTYCSGPFPAELQSCPHCGAPAKGREAA